MPSLLRSEAKFRDDYSLTFSQSGIHFSTAHIDSQLPWSMYSRALIDEHSYVLYYGSRQFTVIPKRVFQNPEQQQIFEQLLNAAWNVYRGILEKWIFEGVIDDPYQEVSY